MAVIIDEASLKRVAEVYGDECRANLVKLAAEAEPDINLVSLLDKAVNITYQNQFPTGDEGKLRFTSR